MVAFKYSKFSSCVKNGMWKEALIPWIAYFDNEGRDYVGQVPRILAMHEYNKLLKRGWKPIADIGSSYPILE
jgi:hypothetical protein